MKVFSSTSKANQYGDCACSFNEEIALEESPEVILKRECETLSYGDCACSFNEEA
jgi:hypothetical protein